MEWKRNIADRVAQDLDKKYVFVSGPRQVGKTTLAKSLKEIWGGLTYLNYDAGRDRSVMLKAEWDRRTPLVVFDEIHKYRRWKQLIKGVFDTEGIPPRLLVTGSARLDVYRRGGDSLAGRYVPFRLHPFSVRELVGHLGRQEALEAIMMFGGFPEPLIGQSEAAARRWRKLHFERIIREDIRDLEPIRDLNALALLVELLQERVTSRISMSSIAGDLQVSPHTIKHWNDVLEKMYLLFKVTPFHRNIARAILKEPKAYFYDAGAVKGDNGARLENAVACCLRKWIDFQVDSEGRDLSLHFLADKEKREVDFVIVEGKRPIQLIEVKWSEESPSPALRYYHERLRVDAYQLVGKDVRPRTVSGITVEPAAAFLSRLEV